MTQTIEELENALSQAQRALAELDKVRAGKHGEAAVTLRQRRHEAQQAVWQAEIVCIDAIAEQDSREIDALRLATQEADEAFQRARDALSTAQSRQRRCELRMASNRERRAQLTVRLMDLGIVERSPISV